MIESIVASIGGIGGVMAVNKLVDFFGYKKSAQYKAQVERDERLNEFQKMQQRENQAFQLARDAQQNEFQLARDAESRRFQMEMEANKMAFQERLEMRRLQVQKQLEDQRSRLAVELNKRQIQNSWEIARFNAMAVRETQILVARENAQNMLQDRMIQDALKNFPLNISPLVLLKNRPHALASLLRFTIAEKAEAKNINITDFVEDVIAYSKNPEALNVFVAPVYVDSKINNREVLSRQIWDTTYQKMESFFTEFYNRRSERPVIFYPTAWNDKYTAGMHASETLHFFLRDMPCIVLEPRFDGNKFRVMVSSWGMSYSSTEHIRAELNFDVNIDAILAYSVYERSKKAISVLEDLEKADIFDSEKEPLFMRHRMLERNIKLYESLHIEERISNGRLDEIDALGIYNIFKIEPVQDLALLADGLSAQIGMTLASLADIHHLRTTETKPIFPMLMKEQFPMLFANQELRKGLYDSYKKVFASLIKEDSYILSNDDRKLLLQMREEEIKNVGIALELIEKKDDIEGVIREIAKNEFDCVNSDFEVVWETCLEKMTERHKSLFEQIIYRMEGDEKWTKKWKQLDKKLNLL